MESIGLCKQLDVEMEGNERVRDNSHTSGLDTNVDNSVITQNEKNKRKCSGLN